MDIFLFTWHPNTNFKYLFFAPLFHDLQMISLYYIPTHLVFLFLIFLVTVIFRICYGWNVSCPSTAVPVRLHLDRQIWSPDVIIVSVEFLVINKSIWKVYQEFIKQKNVLPFPFKLYPYCGSQIDCFTVSLPLCIGYFCFVK